VKKFLFGLIFGLIVGLIGTLAFIQTMNENDENDDQSAIFLSDQKRKKKIVEGIAGARLKLRTWLDGKSPEQMYEAHLDFLDSAIFDRQWASVSVLSKSLRSLQPKPSMASKTAALASAPNPETGTRRPLASLRQQLEKRRFWTELLQHKNEALTLLETKSSGGLLGKLQKFLRNPASTERDEALRHDAAFLIGRYCGVPGIRYLVGFVLRSSDPDDHELGTLAIARSGQASSLAVLTNLCQESRDQSIQKSALSSFPHIDSVINSDSEACKTIGDIISNSSRPLDIRVAASSIVTHVNLNLAKSLLNRVTKVLSNPSENELLRVALLQSISHNARQNVSQHPALAQSIEAIAKTERDSLIRCEALKALEYIGTKKSLKALLDSEPTINNADCRQALKKSRQTLIRRFGQD
jgi:hypothetical protein